MNINQVYEVCAQHHNLLFLIPMAFFIVGVGIYYFIKIVLEKRGEKYGKAWEHAKVPFIILFLIFGVYLSIRCTLEDTKILDMWASIILVVLALLTASRISDGILFAVLERFTKKTKTKLLGICGGYQMMFENIIDKQCVEVSKPTKIKALGFIDDDIIFQKKKNINFERYLF